MTHQLPKLPWSYDALTPYISPETLEYHYGKYHDAYVKKLNAEITDTEFENSSLEEIIRSAKGGLFNNAAQVWNHTFYWNCLAPNAGGAPTGAIADSINEKWGSFEEFKADFSNSAATNFGSGWTWLIKESSGNLSILNTDDAQTPITEGLTAVMTIDVWEHAYYLDYKSSRSKYIEAFWSLVNWDFINSNL
jgi:superoxide dismutase, Fe-Mn family